MFLMTIQLIETWLFETKPHPCFLNIVISCDTTLHAKKNNALKMFEVTFGAKVTSIGSSSIENSLVRWLFRSLLGKTKKGR